MAFNPDSQLDPSQVEDRRGQGGGGFGGGGGVRGGGFGRGPVVIGGGVGGGIGILILIIALLLGVGPLGGSTPTTYTSQPALPGLEQTTQQCQTGADANRREDCRIVGFVNSIQAYWGDELSSRGWQYTPARTVLFSGATQAGCGFASAAQGPFYCPTDGRVYLDLSFFEELQSRFGARGGPFAEGYVVAHEYGHHVQNLLGLLGRSGANAQGARGGSVRTELQADCFAGVWAHNAAATGYLQPPSQQDIAAALDAAAAVGDDRIQRQTQGRVTPESWTHGSSAQRQQWFSTGYRSGNLNACDTSGRL